MLLNWDFERFWAWAQPLQDPRDKEGSRGVEIGLVSSWKPETWNPASETPQCSIHGHGVTVAGSECCQDTLICLVDVHTDVYTDQMCIQTLGICC